MSDNTASADRIAPFTTLWESYTGADCHVIAGLFNRAADLLEAEGYARYPREEDPDSRGVTLTQALERVARDDATAAGARFGYKPTDKMIDQDTRSLAEELENRLGAVLLVTGQVNHVHRNGPAADLWNWTHDAVYGPRSARYRGREHVTRLLRVASVMTMATVAAAG